jgi:NAD(P)-dependent dehydrogenase (short-subunit alcohol dehydrogenase family)
MDLQLEGRRALVTGSTAGIGFAIARGLAAEGARVTVTGRTQANVDAALERMRESVPGAQVDGIAADCASAEGAQAMFARLPEVEILVNNLGIYERKSFFEIPDEDWLRLFEVNVMSGVRFSRHYLPPMVKRGWGRVLFVSSESGLNIARDMIHYGVTKTAQLSIARGLAIETAGTGVTVNTLLPGPTRTATTERQRAERASKAGITVEQLEKDFFVNVRPSSLIKRFASVDEVAPMAVYLCSPLASATTGAALRVEGGIVNQIM